jgi:hypothetical protein
LLTATGASGKSSLASDEVESHAPESDEFVVAPVELFVAPGEFAVDQVLVAPIEFVVDPDVAALAESHETSCPPTVCVTLRGTATSSAAPARIDQDELKKDRCLKLCLNCAAIFPGRLLDRVDGWTA